MPVARVAFGLIDVVWTLTLLLLDQTVVEMTPAIDHLFRGTIQKVSYEVGFV